MSRRIEILDTTLRDGNKLPFVVLSTAERVALARQLARLGVDVIEAGFPAASAEEADCVARVCAEVQGPRVAALARALPADVDRALEALAPAAQKHLHLFMSVAPQFLGQVLRQSEEQALSSIARLVQAGKSAGVRVQFSLSEAPHARAEFLLDACRAACEAGADVINVADTNGILVPADVSDLVSRVRGIAEARRPGPPLVGIHCHNDLGLATANTLAAIEAGASHVEVTLGGFGERAGNAPLEEIAFLLAAYGERWSVTHGIRLSEIARTARFFDSLTGIRAHPNRPVTGQCAFVPTAGGFAGASLPPRLHELFQEKTIGRGEPAAVEVPGLEEQQGRYRLESFSVMTGSQSPPVGVVVISREGSTLTQSSHGTGPIDALFRAVDRALGFSTKMVQYSVSTLATGTEAETEVIVTVELRGRKFHGRHRSTDVIDASLRAYLKACNAIGGSGVLDGTADFHVHGEYLWE
jgi:2-isopropylmalate synthase